MMERVRKAKGRERAKEWVIAANPLRQGFKGRVNQTTAAEPAEVRVKAWVVAVAAESGAV